MQRSLTRIERRYAQDGGHIWLGSEAPLPIVPDLITYSSNLSEEELSKLQAMITPYYPECLFIASDVLEKFLEYAREDHWFTPVPPMTTPESVRLQSRPPEEG